MNLLKGGEDYWTVQPKPAFCAKFRKDGSKVFLNVCICPQLPRPVLISEDELVADIESDEPSKYKIPLSVSAAHDERDKAGKECVVYDVIINEEFYQKRVKTSPLFKTYVLLVAVDSIRQKHGVELDHNSWTLLRNRKFVGTIMPQFIQMKPKPVFEELQSDVEPSHSAGAERRILRRPPSISPLYILEVDDDKCPASLTGRFTLGGIHTSEEINFRLGATCMKLTAADKYNFHAVLPVKMDHKHAKGEFNISTKQLIVTVPLLKEQSRRAMDTD